MCTLVKERHICFLYRTYEEQSSLLSCFFLHGLQKKEKIVYIISDSSSQQQLNTLVDRLSLKKSIHKRQIKIIGTQEIHGQEETFKSSSIIESLQRETQQALEEGYTGLRITGEVSSILGERDVDSFLGYESKVNDFLDHSNCFGLCMYNHNNMSPKDLLNVLQTHPFITYQEVVYKNNYYMSQDLFLQEERVSPPSVRNRRYDKVDELYQEIYIEILKEELKGMYNQGHTFQYQKMLALSEKLDKHIYDYLSQRLLGKG